MRRTSFHISFLMLAALLFSAAGLSSVVPEQFTAPADSTVALHPKDSVTTKSRTGCIPVGSLAQDSLAFKAGETMSFVLHYNWGVINSDVGTATVRLSETDYNGIPAFHCDVSGRTTRLFDLVFRVREQFDSWFTRDGLHPLKFTRDTHEGRYDATNTYIYDWERSVILADVYSSSSGQRNIELPLDRCTYDLPALFFLARNMNMNVVTPETRYPMTFAIDDDIYNVHFILHGRETIDVKGLGRINTIKFSARLLAGEVFRSDTDMTIYISDDANRLPVYFEAPLLVGKAAGRMNSYSNLAHPFSSMVKERRR